MQSREQVFKYPDATVRVRRPDLAPEERERRMAKIKQAAEILLREVIKNELRTPNADDN